MVSRILPAVNGSAFLSLLTFFLACKFQSATSQISIKNYTVSDGLPQTQVNCMGEDSSGQLWLGTLGGGVALFDGVEFTAIDMSTGLADNMVFDLLVDGNEAWALTTKGVSRIKNKQVKNFYPSASASFQRKLFKISDTLFFPFAHNKMGAIVNDSVILTLKCKWIDVVSVVKSIAGLTILDRQAEKHLITLVSAGTHKDFVVEGDFSKLYGAVKKGDQLILRTNEGLFEQVGNSFVFKQKLGVPIYAYDVNRSSWLGLADSKLVEVRDDNLNPLYDYKVSVISSLADSEKLLWLGTDRGLSKIAFTQFQLLKDNGGNDPITSINIINGQIWAGSSNQGVKIYTDNSLSNNLKFNSSWKNFINSIKKKDNDIYISTLGGLAKVNEKSLLTTWVQPGLIHGAVSLDFDNNGNMVVSSPSKGAFWISGNSGDTIPCLSRDIVWTVHFHKKSESFLLATDHGLKRLNSNKVCETFSSGELTDTQVSVITELTSDTLLLGTFGRGIFKYSLKNGIIQKIDESNGLLSNTIFFIFQEGNRTWVGTERGIDLLQYDSGGGIKSIQHFHEVDGLSGLETNLNAVFKSGNQLYFGLVSGLYRYNESQRPQQRKIYINEIKSYNNKTKGESLIDSSQKKVRLSSDQNNLTFSFRQINKRDPELIFYKYKLVGFDSIWSKPSRQHTVTYGNLPPGDYSFKVISCDKSGFFHFHSDNFQFYIEPAYYQRWEFKVALTLMGIGAVFLVAYLYNTSRIKKSLRLQEMKDMEKTKLRKEIARDFHDELGNLIARMISYIGILSIEKKLEKKDHQSLHEFSQSILIGTRDFVWSMDPANDDLSNTVIHLIDFGERMFHEKGIEFRFHGSTQLTFKLPMGYSRQINLIFKEAMTNAFRHADSTVVDFELSEKEGRYCLSFSDEGRGIPPDVILNSGQGLRNMKVRAARINSKIDIITDSHGTKIILETDLRSTRDLTNH